MLSSVSVIAAQAAPAATQFAGNFTALNIGTTSWVKETLSIKITNSASNVPAGESLVFKYLTSVYAGEGSPTNIRSLAKSINVPLPSAANAITYATVPPYSSLGSTLYVWIEHTAWAQARTIDVTVSGSSV